MRAAGRPPKRRSLTFRGTPEDRLAPASCSDIHRLLRQCRRKLDLRPSSGSSASRPAWAPGTKALHLKNAAGDAEGTTAGCKTWFSQIGKVHRTASSTFRTSHQFDRTRRRSAHQAGQPSLGSHAAWDEGWSTTSTQVGAAISQQVAEQDEELPGGTLLLIGGSKTQTSELICRWKIRTSVTTGNSAVHESQAAHARRPPESIQPKLAPSSSIHKQLAKVAVAASLQVPVGRRSVSSQCCHR